MSKVNLIQTFYKGFSCYLPKTKKNLVLKDLPKFLFNENVVIEHFFIYFDDRLGRGFRLFVQTSHSSELLQTKFIEFLKKYDSGSQNLKNQHQFFKTYPPFSVVPIRFIEESDEIFTSKGKLQSIQNLLKNLNLLISQKTKDFDFSDDNQKLEFTLELLISGVAFNIFSRVFIQQEFKLMLKSIPDYKKYLDDNYAQRVEESKNVISIFKESLILEENKHNLLSLFWKTNKVENDKKVIEVIFKVLNISVQQQCYCLYILHNT